MSITLQNRPLGGCFDAPPSKSVAHRLMIATVLAGGSPEDVAIPGTVSQDIAATAACLEALMASDTPVLDCGESGSTLRFLLPVAAALGKRATFTGRGRLPERPLGPLMQMLSEHGATSWPLPPERPKKKPAPHPLQLILPHRTQDVEFREHLPLKLAGQLLPGYYLLPGNVSSQFISGMLFAMPLLELPSRLELTTPLESADYVRLTIAALKQFGVDIQANPELTRFDCGGNTRYTRPRTLPLAVEGDWSNAAFFLAAGALGGAGVTARGLNSSSGQGDRAVLDLLERFGAQVAWEDANNTVRVRAGALTAIPAIDVRAIPDLVPILAVVAGLAQGTTAFVNAARLRLKESDRLETTAQLLRALGGQAETTPDTLYVTGVNQYAGGTVDSCNDHRIAMAAAIAATRADGPVTLRNPAAVAKSWPDFFAVCETLRRNAIIL